MQPLFELELHQLRRLPPEPLVRGPGVVADLVTVGQHGELHEPSRGRMVTGHLLAEPRLESVLEHADLPLYGKVPPLGDPVACGRRHRDCSTKVPLLFTNSCRRPIKTASWSLLNTTSRCSKPNFFWEGARPLRRELVAGTLQRHDAPQEVFRSELLFDENAPGPRVGGRAQEAAVNVHLWNLRVSVLFPVVDGPAFPLHAV